MDRGRWDAAEDSVIGNSLEAVKVTGVGSYKPCDGEASAPCSLRERECAWASGVLCPMKSEAQDCGSFEACDGVGLGACC